MESGIDWWMTMKFNYSLRSRITITFCLFGAILGFVYATVVYISLDYIDDNLVNTRLEQEFTHLGIVYQSTAGPLIPTSPNIKVYRGTDSMPADVKRLVSGISEGVHEKHHDDIEYHIGVKVFPGRIEPLYLLFDVSSLEFTEIRKIRIGLVLAGCVAFVTFLGLWVGILLSKSVIVPVVHLADQVKQLEPENLPGHLSESFTNDEVGVLAKALDQTVQRIRYFVERERRFTRDASHELRTPVTVIKGAVEILKTHTITGKRSVIRPLNRIERAVADMENLIEAFLWLGREETLLHSGETCDVVPILDKIVKQFRLLFVDKPVEIELITQEKPVLKIPPPLFQAVVANLIKNAFQSTNEGRICIRVSKDRMVISDTGNGIATCDLPVITEPYVRGEPFKDKGFGVGLAIVKRLCHRFDWYFEIESDTGKGTTIYLYFQHT